MAVFLSSLSCISQFACGQVIVTYVPGTFNKEWCFYLCLNFNSPLYTYKHTHHTTHTTHTHTHTHIHAHTHTHTHAHTHTAHTHTHTHTHRTHTHTHTHTCARTHTHIHLNYTQTNNFACFISISSFYMHDNCSQFLFFCGCHFQKLMANGFPSKNDTPTVCKCPSRENASTNSYVGERLRCV